ncbi:hypothetical protein J6590_082145 [Homalodisca vitripennis]|nr:hypothetical protein J6590_082145 [Homalodisca vitripennis]
MRKSVAVGVAFTCRRLVRHSRPLPFPQQLTISSFFILAIGVHRPSRVTRTPCRELMVRVKLSNQKFNFGDREVGLHDWFFENRRVVQRTGRSNITRDIRDNTPNCSGVTFQAGSSRIAEWYRGRGEVNCSGVTFQAGSSRIAEWYRGRGEVILHAIYATTHRTVVV